MNALIDEPELLAKTGCTSRAQLRAWMASRGVKYLPGARGRVMTTLHAIDAAMGLGQSDAANDESLGKIEIL
jgi:hypothetical protein